MMNLDIKTGEDIYHSVRLAKPAEEFLNKIRTKWVSTESLLKKLSEALPKEIVCCKNGVQEMSPEAKVIFEIYEIWYEIGGRCDCEICEEEKRKASMTLKTKEKEYRQR